MEPRGLGRVIQVIKGLVAAPFRATGELLGLLVGGSSKPMSPDRLAGRSKRRRMLLAAMPACLGLIAACGFMGWSMSLRQKSAVQYWDKLIAAISQNKGLDASRLAQRVFEFGVRNSPEKALEYSQFLAGQNELFQANSILEKIAPDDQAGYSPAHAQRAVAFSQLLSQGISDRYLPVLEWHLKQAGEPSSESLWIAWANYYRLTGKVESCTESLESAAKLDPSHWFSVADLYVLDAKPELARRALTNAINAYRLKLGKDPLAIDDRLQLALAQARTGEYPQASETLKSGLELQPQNQKLLQAQSQLEVIRLEQSIKQASNISQRLEIARELISKSSDPTSTYHNTVEWYQQTVNEQDRQLIEAFLQECFERNGPNPTLMFSQGVIRLVQGKLTEARARFTETIDAFPNHGFSLNNLAWLLATEEPKDLSKAELYARRAIETDPQMATFHDTLGTIYLEQGQWRSAIAELELALSQSPIPNRIKIHGKLARAYEAVGDSTLASMHRERSVRK